MLIRILEEVPSRIRPQPARHLQGSRIVVAQGLWKQPDEGYYKFIKKKIIKKGSSP
jgi:hypothetical protein